MNAPVDGCGTAAGHARCTTIGSASVSGREVTPGCGWWWLVPATVTPATVTQAVVPVAIDVSHSTTPGTSTVHGRPAEGRSSSPVGAAIEIAPQRINAVSPDGLHRGARRVRRLLLRVKPVLPAEVVRAYARPIAGRQTGQVYVP